jgi:hypothetical protein
MMKRSRESSARFVVCIHNDGYAESLEVRKLYRVIPDAKAAKVAHIRVIDESGEDYLYPKDFFSPVRLTEPTKRTLASA